MSLASLYNQAATNTYVGRVRTRQAANAPTNQTLVNFMDGTRRGQNNTEADEFQTEFTRNAPGTHVAGGAQGISRAPGQTYTRWTDKSFKLAFDGEGPVQLVNGFYTNQFRPLYTDLNGLQRQVHRYTPALDKKFGEVNSAARAKIASSPSGAPRF